MEKIWNKLYNAAKNVLNPRKVSSIIEAGGVSAAIETESGKIYVGVCVDSACSLGICAERNAIFNMITNGEYKIKKIIAINSEGKVIPPCGACREYLMQLSKNSKDIEILMDEKTKEFVKLEKLIPDWWGYDRV